MNSQNYYTSTSVYCGPHFDTDFHNKVGTMTIVVATQIGYDRNLQSNTNEDVPGIITRNIYAFHESKPISIYKLFAETAKKRAATSPMSGAPAKKSVSRREELLKQLKAVEDAIARKRSKI